jgi:hypothetical protein
VRRQVREMAGQGQDPPVGHIPFTLRQRVIQLAQVDSLNLKPTVHGRGIGSTELRTANSELRTPEAAGDFARARHRAG